MPATIGIMAHVDAGKTTFCEQLLYHAQALRARGRVDHQDAFLDYHPLERERGITIFSDQAVFDTPAGRRFLLDTPGHVDFSGETERALAVMDLGLMIISGVEGVQSHTETLLTLADARHLPLTIFINKMDREGADCTQTMGDITRVCPNAVLFTGHFTDGVMDTELAEAVAERDDSLMETYFDSGYNADTWNRALVKMVATCRIVPVFTGSALRDTGVTEVLDALPILLPDSSAEPTAPFAAIVHKIRYDDADGSRVTHLKVTAGTLNVRDVIGDEKISGIRRYNGGRFQAVDQAVAGELCAVTGLTQTQAGQSLGAGTTTTIPASVPLFTARVMVDDDTDNARIMAVFRQLAEEDPLLGVRWDEQSSCVHVNLMGAIQTEILAQTVQTRFGIAIHFGPAAVVYKETLAAPTPGYGHFEPLRHYAEVCLRLEPGEPGSGITFSSECSQDVLATNWQRLIETHVFEREHLGVLTGSAITDIHIVLTGGRAHDKHTEGGDFRQATYRAIRQGLMAGDCVLLEPLWRFSITVPTTAIGKVMADILRMSGTFDAPESIDAERSHLSGTGPVATMMDYPQALLNQTQGRGLLRTQFAGYAPCHNADAVIADRAYDPITDAANPTASVFCSHGAGYAVPWDDVHSHMHTLK